MMGSIGAYVTGLFNDREVDSQRKQRIPNPVKY